MSDSDVRTGAAAPRLGRRAFFGAAATIVAGVSGARRLAAQEQEGNPQTAQTEGVGMDGTGYRPVTLPPKAGAAASMTDDQRDALEHQLSCPCPCTLDVYTCRTSMPCGYSPQLHADVRKLVAGGYSGDEILAAFVTVYGEEALMAPVKSGFNWAGYLAPSAAIVAGGVAIAAFIKRKGVRAVPAAPSRAETSAAGDADADELARLDAAVRGDGR